uniref:Uncharacterized protein n=1 Tax=Arundo donax TaxID=35708 RepID=A0A0A9CER5_ARUDO
MVVCGVPQHAVRVPRGICSFEGMDLIGYGKLGMNLCFSFY